VRVPFSRARGLRALAAGVILAGCSLVAGVSSAHASIGGFCQPTPDGSPIIGPSDGCTEMHRTLVFVGQSSIDNGVNFAGTGQDGSDPGGGTGGGGHFDFTGGGSNLGGCVMVDWDGNTVSGPGLVVSDCHFNTTNGFYFGPATADPVVRNLVGTCSALYPVLGFDPDGNGTGALSPGCPVNGAVGTVNHNPAASQANCFNSSGRGTSSFISQGLPGGTETWTSSYTWSNALTNLRGSISNGSLTMPFDAKIRADADPAGALGRGDLLDANAAGCLQKTAKQLQGQATNGNDGLNSILVVGTATWRLDIPVVFP
jgi:hypothetical protein